MLRQKTQVARSIPPTTPEVGVLATRLARPLIVPVVLPSPYMARERPLRKVSSAFSMRLSRRLIMASSPLFCSSSSPEIETAIADCNLLLCLYDKGLIFLQTSLCYQRVQSAPSLPGATSARYTRPGNFFPCLARYCPKLLGCPPTLLLFSFSPFYY